MEMREGESLEDMLRRAFSGQRTEQDENEAILVRQAKAITMMARYAKGHITKAEAEGLKMDKAANAEEVIERMAGEILYSLDIRTLAYALALMSVRDVAGEIATAAPTPESGGTGQYL